MQLGLSVTDTPSRKGALAPASGCPRVTGPGSPGRDPAEPTRGTICPRGFSKLLRTESQGNGAQSFFKQPRRVPGGGAPAFWQLTSKPPPSPPRTRAGAGSLPPGPRCSRASSLGAEPERLGPGARGQQVASQTLSQMTGLEQVHGHQNVSFVNFPQILLVSVTAATEVTAASGKPRPAEPDSVTEELTPSGHLLLEVTSAQGHRGAAGRTGEPHPSANPTRLPCRPHPWPWGAGTPPPLADFQECDREALGAPSWTLQGPHPPEHRADNSHACRCGGTRKPRQTIRIPVPSTPQSRSC